MRRLCIILSFCLAALATVLASPGQAVAGSARPKMVRAVIDDANGDGKLDRLTVSFSKPIKFAGSRRARRALKVRGYRITRVPRVRFKHDLTASLRPSKPRGGVRTTKVSLAARRKAGPVDRSGRVARSGSLKAVIDARRGPRPGPSGAAGPSPGAPAPARPAQQPPAPKPPDPPPARGWNVLDNPIDPLQQTAMGFGERSHWLQPWRGYLDTVPATRLRDAIGINFNVRADEAQGVAKLLAESGFRRARIEIGWSEMDYADPTKLRNPGPLRQKISALVQNGIRPLVLLNAHHGVPGPHTLFDARLTAPAPQGAREVILDSATADAVVPGRTGLNSLTGDYKAADVIFTSVSPGGVAQLSKPLPRSLAPGAYDAATLRYEPFTAPLTLAGGPNPAFERTLSGWIDYVSATTKLAKEAVGADDFDVEVWNELSFGSDFLSIDRYYQPVPSSLSGRGDVNSTLLQRTLQWLRDPANGVSGVGVSDGFASQTPFSAGSTSPAGLTAMSKHPYKGITSFPGQSIFNNIRPLDALGRPEGQADGSGNWHDSFTPSYRAFFPEYHMTGIRTETIVRDLSPITTSVYGTPHGRHTQGPGATRPPEVWITETNMIMDGAGLDAAAKRHVQAKATMRSIAAWVNKGVSALDFYAVGDGDFGMVDGGFFQALHANGGAYPGASRAGETMTAVRRLTEGFAGATPISSPRQLQLHQIADQHNRKQFSGDGTAAHPALYNRDVLAFLPFQLDDRTFVAPVYVMTRDMAQVHRPDASSSDVTRYDLPPEKYRLTIGGIRGATPQVSLRDPMTGSDAPVQVVSREGDRLTIQLEATDSPRLLKIRETG